MKLERASYLNADSYQRTAERKSYANGFKDKTVSTRLGKIELKVPQTRDGEFYPSVLERGERSERALKLALAEIYLQGVSTRKVAKIMEELCGTEVTSTQTLRIVVRSGVRMDRGAIHDTLATVSLNYGTRRPNLRA